MELQHYLEFLIAKQSRLPKGMELSVLPVAEVRKAGLHLRFKQLLELRPTADETGTLLCVRQEALGIDVFAPSRQELLGEVQDQIVLLWREYACAPPETLTPGARRLRANLLSQVEEVARAA